MMFCHIENCLGQMRSVEHDIKDKTESNTAANYLDLLLSLGRNGQLHTSIYNKRYNFNFHTPNVPEDYNMKRDLYLDVYTILNRI